MSSNQRENWTQPFCKILVQSCFLLLSLKYTEQNVRVHIGRIAKRGQFPFYALLIIPSFNYNPFSPVKPYPPNATFHDIPSEYCSGSLIHPKWILTAAHCFYVASLEQIAQGYPIDLVFMGKFQRTYSTPYTNAYRTVVFHPDHQPRITYVTAHIPGIALLKLEKKYTFSFLVQPAILPIEKAQLKKRCNVGVIMGVSIISWFDPKPSEILYFTYLRVTNEQPIEIEHDTGLTFYSKILMNYVLPLIGEDYGSPFVCYLSRIPVQYGVVSRVTSNIKEEMTISVFENLAKYMNFIKEVVPDINKYSNRTKILENDTQINAGKRIHSSFTVLITLYFATN